MGNSKESEKTIQSKSNAYKNIDNNQKVLFVVHDVYQEHNQFPLGIGYLAAVLRRNGIDVTIYCQDIYHYSNEDLAQYLQCNEFDLIGVGFLGARFMETIVELSKVIVKYKKDAWYIMGGHGPAPIPEYILRKTHSDIVAMGEAEDTIIELLRAKKEKIALHKIRGIAFREGPNIYVNSRRSPIKDLDSIPFPEWSLFPISRYVNSLKIYRSNDKDRVLGIITSRGCTNRCTFCYRMEKGIRFRSIPNVIDEMKILNHTYGINYFLMNDEMFVYSKKRIFQFQDALKKEGLKIKFSCAARVDNFDMEIAECLKECGCQFLNFGIESSDQNVLNNMKKHTTIEDNIRAVEITRKLGIGIGLNFIFGTVGDNETILKENVRIIKKYNSYDQLRTIRPVTPYPGSDLYQEAIAKGLLGGPDDFFNKFKNSDLVTVNFTKIPKSELYRMLFEANKELIEDHYHHTTNNPIEMKTLIDNFHKLYFDEDYSFRGARDYSK